MTRQQLASDSSAGRGPLGSSPRPTRHSVADPGYTRLAIPYAAGLVLVVVVPLLAGAGLGYTF